MKSTGLDGEPRGGVVVEPAGERRAAAGGRRWGAGWPGGGRGRIATPRLMYDHWWVIEKATPGLHFPSSARGSPSTRRLVVHAGEAKSWLAMPGLPVKSALTVRWWGKSPRMPGVVYWRSGAVDDLADHRDLAPGPRCPGHLTDDARGEG